MAQVSIKTLLQTLPENQSVTAKGWVRTRRGNKNISFIALNDGSTIHNIQIVAELANFNDELLKSITTGSCISVNGRLVASQGQGQKVEILADEIHVYGSADPSTFPLQKKGHTLEFLREIAHLRPRTNTFGAVFRIRHAMAYAIHHYFNRNGFYYIHTPIITGTDAEGAGEMFKVTTLNVGNPPRNDDGTVDYDQDFFGKETSLTVSGQLEGELAAMALGKIYTFGPTFRAEYSNTPRHLAEFWMIGYALENCSDDIELLNNMYDKELIGRLRSVIDKPFTRITYTQAIEVLQPQNSKFEFQVQWGSDLQKEHENYLVEHFKGPVILTDYPAEIKAFYMKLNDDGKTVRAMDVLFPWIGEIIGGSQREEDYDKLLQRMKKMHIPEQDMWWYLDTRKYGTCPHAGFGLGFERLMLFVTGMNNIRDVIPFPRTPRNAAF